MKLWRDLEVGEEVKTGDRVFIDHGQTLILDSLDIQSTTIKTYELFMMPHQRLVIEDYKE